MRNIKHIISDTLHLFYPHHCTGCGSDLLYEHNLLCLKCIHALPHTFEAAFANNHTERIFTGRLPLTGAFSEFYFAKDSLIQLLIHQLKYKSNQAIGVYLGEMIGRSLLDNQRFGEIDMIVPLPLYPDKEHKRGYNQAAVIGKGVSNIINSPVSILSVSRKRFTETQTRKGRTERWENVAGSFAAKHSKDLEGKHILLVDDVVTTGATLEACGRAMLQAANCRLSIATLAYASK